jgi:hypothetical protein
VSSSKKGKKTSKEKIDPIPIPTISEESIRKLVWKSRWEEVKEDMELFPENDVQEALLYILSRRMYSRWLLRWEKYRSEEILDQIQEMDIAQYRMLQDGTLQDDPPPEIKTVRGALIAYWAKLECKFGIIFLMSFSLLTLLPLFILSLIWKVQYQPLVYLLFISAVMIIYSSPPIGHRQRNHRIKCFAIPVIVTLYRIINSDAMPSLSLWSLWIFMIFHYVFLHFVTWLLVAKERKYFDPFGIAYLSTIKNFR